MLEACKAYLLLFAQFNYKLFNPLLILEEENLLF